MTTTQKSQIKRRVLTVLSRAIPDDMQVVVKDALLDWNSYKELTGDAFSIMIRSVKVQFIDSKVEGFIEPPLLMSRKIFPPVSAPS